MSDFNPPSQPARTELETIQTAEVVPLSPRWSIFTKFLISMVVIVIVGALLVRFQQMIAPLVMAVILAYVLRPVVVGLTTQTRLSWGTSVAVVYITLIILLIAIATVAGIAIVQQMEGLYRAIVRIATDLPGQLEIILSQPIDLGPLGVIPDLRQPFTIGPFGPFRVPIEAAEWEPVYQQIAAALQPVLSRTGDLVATLATGTASTVGWSIFILVVSYYLLNDLSKIAPSLESIVPEGYIYDARRIVGELGPIWNAFLRGQVTLAIIMGIVVWLTMWILGVRYPLVLGLLAGILEFIPILGPVIAGTVAVLVALFQPNPGLGLSPIAFAAVVLAASVLVQQLENHILIPRILGRHLKLHPAIIVIGALIAASLAGIVGLLLAAPAMATFKLIGRYISRKMFDLNPWPDPPTPPRPPPEYKWARWLRRRASALWAARGTWGRRA
jgi:predicted PurR-regulated permease PerM